MCFYKANTNKEAYLYKLFVDAQVFAVATPDVCQQGTRGLGPQEVGYQGPRRVTCPTEVVRYLLVHLGNQQQVNPSSVIPRYIIPLCCVMYHGTIG